MSYQKLNMFSLNILLLKIKTSASSQPLPFPRCLTVPPFTHCTLSLSSAVGLHQLFCAGGLKWFFFTDKKVPHSSCCSFDLTLWWFKTTLTLIKCIFADSNLFLLLSFHSAAPADAGEEKSAPWEMMNGVQSPCLMTRSPLCLFTRVQFDTSCFIKVRNWKTITSKYFLWKTGQ